MCLGSAPPALCKAALEKRAKAEHCPEMPSKVLPPTPRITANPAPPRPGNSVRRTSSIDVSWPDGEAGDRLFVGRVRDYRTPAGGGGRTIEEAGFRAVLAPDKTITAISAEPPLPGIERLVGLRAGNHLRLAVKDAMPGLIAAGAPIYLALDDISGTAFVSAYAWMQYDGKWAERLREQLATPDFAGIMAARVDICWGLKDGNSALSPDFWLTDIAASDAGDLRNRADPQGWHTLPESEGPGFRRARRIDVTRDPSGPIHIAAAFQDSAKRGDGGREGIHEYDIEATVDPGTYEILTLASHARVVPYPECPGAVRNTQRLIGARIGDIRDEVLSRLRGPEGCTHLNDALRALAEVPKLAGYLAV